MKTRNKIFSSNENNKQHVDIVRTSQNWMSRETQIHPALEISYLNPKQPFILCFRSVSVLIYPFYPTVPSLWQQWLQSSRWDRKEKKNKKKRKLKGKTKISILWRILKFKTDAHTKLSNKVRAGVSVPLLGELGNGECGIIIFFFSLLRLVYWDALRQNGRLASPAGVFQSRLVWKCCTMTSSQTGIIRKTVRYLLSVAPNGPWELIYGPRRLSMEASLFICSISNILEMLRFRGASHSSILLTTICTQKK